MLGITCVSVIIFEVYGYFLLLASPAHSAIFLETKFY